VIPWGDPSFRHGRGVFETLRVRDGRARFFLWHHENLCRAAQALGIDWAPAKNIPEPPQGDGLWRWFLTPQGFWTDWEEGLAAVPPALRLATSRLVLSSASWEAHHKTLSYLLHWQAREEARLHGADEALLGNEHGEAAGAAMANLFFRSGGIWHTPDTDCGCRAGVVRRWVLEKSGLRVETGRHPLERVAAADEIFLTNARIGVCPVTAVDGREVAAGSASAGLRAALEDLNFP
jgi:4-amino-4-deoxychorismate lyase